MTDTLLSDIVIKERPPQETNKNSPFLAKKGQCLSILFFFEEEENNNNKKMGPTVIDTNPATLSSSSFLTTGIWTKLQGKERFSYSFFHSLGSGLADLPFFY